MQSVLDRIVDWCREHGFGLNVKKCSVMSFTCKKNVIEYPYSVGNVLLKREVVHKDVGVLFDPKLTFNLHIDKITKDAYKMLGFVIRCCKKFDNLDAIVAVYRSLVLSRLEYACVIWSPHYATKIDQLERVQRKFLKFFYYKRFGTYPQRGFDNQTLL